MFQWPNNYPVSAAQSKQKPVMVQKHSVFFRADLYNHFLLARHADCPTTHQPHKNPRHWGQKGRCESVSEGLLMANHAGEAQQCSCSSSSLSLSFLWRKEYSLFNGLGRTEKVLLGSSCLPGFRNISLCGQYSRVHCHHLRWNMGH